MTRALTSWGFEYGDLSILKTAVQGAHKLDLDVIRGEWMVEPLLLFQASLLCLALRLHGEINEISESNGLLEARKGDKNKPVARWRSRKKQQMRQQPPGTFISISNNAS